ncbi:ribonuclease H-like domain-containing protein [Tanacetum coccineum]|uniref:Ribonuclease H-like domain-containing protein n=1 Tax=Tanacetum coccineum TaxID=301880 RepID=A0ABQ5BX36_9ASTR
MKLMLFLMGLDDTYMQIRSSILSKGTLHDVRSAYAIISSEESHRVASGSLSRTFQRSQTSVFTVNAPNRGNLQRSEKRVLVGYLNFKKGSPASSKENDEGHLQDADASASESEGFAALEENNSNSEGNAFHDHSQEGINQVNNDVPNLRRCSRPFVFLRNFNDFVVDSKVEYDLKKIVNYSHLSKGNYCFAPILKKGFEPKTYLEASQHKHWVDSMNAEMDALYRNNTWELADLPVGRKAIGSKWVFKIKYKSDGEIERFNARLVAKGFNQKERIYFDKTFSPVVKIITVRCLINLAVVKVIIVYSLSLLVNVFIALLVYVDDIIITGNSLPEINKVKRFLKTKFMIKDLGKLKYFLGIEVLYTSNGVCLNQRKYCLELIDEFGLLVGKPSYIPMQPNISLTSEPSETDPLLDKVTEYQKLIGSPGKGMNVIKGSAFGIDLKAYSDADWASNSAIKIAVNPIFYERTKHLEIDLHFVRENIVTGVIETVKIEIANQIADLLTKRLDTKQHNLLCSKMGLIDMFQNKINGGC